MRLNPDHLIAFARVARHGSVSAAAQSLHRSQPAVSLQLRQLTEAVGEPLYTRHRHGVSLTPTGEALLLHAQAAERAISGAKGVISEIRGTERGQLTVSASMTIAVYLLPRLFAGFRQEHPLLDLRTLTRNSTDVLELLRQGEIEVAMVETPVPADMPGVEQHRFFTDEVVLAAPADHPLRGTREVTPADLQGLHVVTREPGSGTRRVSELALDQHGVKLHASVEADEIEATKEAILQGLGPGFISRLAILRELESGSLTIIKIAGIEINRPMTLLHPPEELCSWASRAFLQFLRQSYPLLRGKTQPRMSQQ